MIVLKDVMYIFDILMGTWQIQIGLLAGQVASFFLIPADDIDELNEEQIFELQTLRIILSVLHIMGAAYLIGNSNPNPGSPYALGVVYVVVPAMFLITWVNVFLAANFFLTNNNGEITSTFDGAEMVNTLLSFCYAFVGLLIATLIFLTIRSFVKPKIRPAIFVKKLKLNPETESLKALRPIMDMFFNNFVPTFVTMILFLFQNTIWVEASSLQDLQIFMVSGTGLISTVLITIVIFVDYKKGSANWTKWAPFVYMIFVWTAYLIMPCANLTYFLFAAYGGAFEQSTPFDLTTWFISANTMFLCNFIDYILTIHQSVIAQLSIYRAIRKEIEFYRGQSSYPYILDLIRTKFLSSGSENDILMTQVLEETYANYSVPYPVRPRRYGEGEIRIQGFLPLNSDCFSLCFMSQLKTRHIMLFIDPDTGEKVSEEDRKNVERYFFKGTEEEIQACWDEIEKGQKIEQEDKGEEEAVPQGDAKYAINSDELPAETPDDSQVQETTGGDEKSKLVDLDSELDDSTTMFGNINKDLGYANQLVRETLWEPKVIKKIQDSNQEDLAKLQATGAGSVLMYNGKILTKKVLQVNEATVEAYRLSYFSQALVCIVIQVLQLYLISVELFSTDKDSLVTFLTDAYLVYMRMSLALMLHMCLIDDVQSGLNSMKFALNHPYLFENAKIAFFSSFMKNWTAFLTEVLNVFYLLETFHSLDMLANFVALQVISTFPYLMNSGVDSPVNGLLDDEICQKVCIIQHTTSKLADYKDPSQAFNDIGEWRPLRVAYKERECMNKFYYILYKINKVTFNVYYYYLAAPFALLLSMFAPLIFELRILVEYVQENDS